MSDARLSSLVGFPQDVPFPTEGPWDAEDTLYFWKGRFSSFALVRGGIWLPAGYAGHEQGEMCRAYFRENYFQACKSSGKEAFERILSASSPREAKSLGGPGGVVGVLRPDWDAVRYAVMLAFARRQWCLPSWQSILLGTGERVLAERSPHDAEWGCYDPKAGTNTGLNLLGICLMHVRHELREAVPPGQKIL